MADEFGAFESDPTADFLAREQAMLGDDAQMFSTGNIDVPISVPQSAGVDTSAVDNDFGNFETITQQTPPSNPMMSIMSPIQSSPMSAVPVNQTAMSPFPVNTFSQAMGTPAALPAIEGTTNNDTGLVEKIITEADVQNSPFVKEANEKRQKIIEERDARNVAKHNDILASAKSDIEKFYADYNQKKNKDSENNRLYQGNNIPPSTNPNELTWELVCSNINFNTVKSKDSDKNMERFKNLLLDLSKSKDYIKIN